MANNDSIAHTAHPNPGGRSGALEHVGEITPRAVMPVIKLRYCAGCGGRFIGRDLYEVQDWHESLTFFEGDFLCRECAGNHGVL